MASQPGKRRWLRFSLRTLMVVMTLLGVWLGVAVERAHHQRRVVKAIDDLGGWVRYAHEWKAGWSGDPGPEWLRDLIGPEYFREPRSVWVDPSTSDQVIADIETEAARLPGKPEVIVMAE